MQSFDSPFARLAREKRTPREVAALMNCDLLTAKRRLQEGESALAARQDQIEQAAQILLHSALSPVMIQTARGPKPGSRWGAWQDVALGLRQAA